MNLALFILLATAWLVILLFHLEKPEDEWRQSAFFLYSFLFGAYFLVSGIQFQTGWSFVTGGGTTTATIVNSDLVTAESGWSYFGWLGIGIGFYGLGVKILFPLVKKWTKIARQKVGM